MNRITKCQPRDKKTARNPLAGERDCPGVLYPEERTCKKVAEVRPSWKSKSLTRKRFLKAFRRSGMLHSKVETQK